MTLNLARNFLLLPFHYRVLVLRNLNALDDDEMKRLIHANNNDAQELYKVAFRRIKERNQLHDLEKEVGNHIQP